MDTKLYPQKIQKTFFEREETLKIAQETVGKFIFTSFDGHLTGGMITEVEAYLGAKDKACHSFGNRKTNRTKVMFESGGVAYVYLCYGMHHLFNIVTHQKEVPHAILIRSLKPHYGIEKMLERRGKTKLDKHLCSGPGNLSKALGMTTADTGKTVTGGEIYLEDHGISSLCIRQTPRIGIDYAEEYRDKPWRFVAQ